MTTDIHAQEHTPTDTQGPGKTVSPDTSVHASSGKINTTTNAEVRAPHRMLAHARTGLACVCLHRYMFLYMYVHAHTHIRSTPAASFSRVPCVYAMAITHARGCMTCTHAEPCAHVHGGGTHVYTHERCPDTSVTSPSSTVIPPAAGCWHAEDVQDLAPVWMAGK